MTVDPTLLIYEDYSWYPGEDQEDNLISVIETAPPGDIEFDAPTGIGNYVPGVFRINFNGSLNQVGFEYIEWYFNTMTRVQLTYIRSWICNGGWSSPVTIKTRTIDNTFYLYNAMLNIDVPTKPQNKFDPWSDIIFKFVHMRPIAEE